MTSAGNDDGGALYDINDESGAPVGMAYAIAYARLWTAAPDLLAACESLLDCIYSGGGDGDTLHAAEHAIAKARGN